MENKRLPEIAIDKDGIWFVDGARMIRQDIIRLFAENMHRDENDNYYIYWQNFHYPVQVAKAPFLAIALEERNDRLILSLYDGRELQLNSGTLIMEEGTPYVSLLWEKDTILSRQVYWQLSEYAVEEEDSIVIKHHDLSMKIVEC